MRPALQLLLLVAVLAAPPRAHAERVDELVSVVHVQRDGVLRVEETIRYDFDGAWRPGIVRDLPNGALAGSPGSIEVEIESVTDEVGRPLPYQLEELPAFDRLRVGDPASRISGQITVHIDYLVTGGLTVDGESAGVDWSATGAGWVVPIERAELNLHVSSLASNEIEAECRGARLDNDSGCATSVAEGAFVFATTRPLGNGQELTVQLRFPSGIVEAPSRSSAIAETLREHARWWMLSPLLTLLALLVRIQRAGGRSSRRGPTIQTEPPKRLRPAQAGVIWDARMDADDVLATMVDLANRGHLEVIETQVGAHQRLSRTQFEISRTLAPPDDLAPYEELLMESLFELSNVVLASDLRHRFYTELVQLEQAVFASMTPRVFAEHPAQVHRRYRTFGALLALLGVFALALPLDPAVCRELALALASAGGLLVFSSAIMPARTGRGAQLRRHLHGLREYLDGHGEEPDPGRFQELLPFAITLGCADIWFTRHQGGGVALPWLILTPPSTTNPQDIAAAIGRFGRELSVSVRTRPTDVGAPTGGFSGGPAAAMARGGRW